MGCIFDPLFQSFICSVILSIKSLSTLTYGTREVFFRHFEISLYALPMVDKVTVIVLPSPCWPHTKVDGTLIASNNVANNPARHLKHFPRLSDRILLGFV